MNQFKNSWLTKRQSGVLLHLSSLPGEYGIGNLGQGSIRFVDFLSDSGFSYWQICPAGPTGYGDSPYQSFSSYAGNPYFLDLSQLIEQGLLTHDEVEPLLHLKSDSIQYGQLYKLFWPILEHAFDRFDTSKPLAGCSIPWDEFMDSHRSWLKPYALFMALKKQHGGKPWFEWDLCYRDYHAVNDGMLSLDTRQERDRHLVYQYLFFNQWEQLRHYANGKGIQIIGDVPIFVAHDSADVWSHLEVFQVKENGQLEVSAGVPPDYFSDSGQYWGNPLYNWDYLKKTGYDWWMKRLEGAFSLYDVIRLDHFRAFATYWEIPGGSPDARKGRWVEGPGTDFFNTVFKTFKESKIIAEDLGYIDHKTYELREYFGLPGMNVLQFGFGHDSNNVNLPHFYTPNSVVYCGTHDNDTTIGWLSSLDHELHLKVWEYFQLRDDHTAWPMIRAAFNSVSRLAIVTMQDLLGLDSKARMNTPGLALENWKWRYTDAQFENLIDQHRDSLRLIHKLSNRTGDEAQHDYSASPEDETVEIA